VPFHFPSGKDLVKIICHFGRPGESSDCKWKPEGLDRSMEETFRLLKTEFGKTKVENFADRLKGAVSIDAFLEHQYKDFEKIGKAAIAAALLPFERQESLFEDMQKNWYQLLWSRLAADAPFDKFEDNKLRVITFNYDRSLEYYLFTMLEKTYPDKEEHEYVVRMPKIIHVHGQLGCLPWQPGADQKNSVPYDAIKGAYEQKQQHSYSQGHPVDDVIKRYFDCARKRIRVIHDDDEDTDDLKQAREWIKSYQRLYFLGFGYHPNNLHKLQVQKLRPVNSFTKGTIQGLSRERKQDAATLTHYSTWRGWPAAPPTLYDGGNYDFLHDHVDLT